MSLVGHLCFYQGQIKCCSKTSFSSIDGTFKFNPFPKRQILDPSKLKRFADDNFKFGKKGGKVL